MIRLTRRPTLMLAAALSALGLAACGGGGLGGSSEESAAGPASSDAQYDAGEAADQSGGASDVASGLTPAASGTRLVRTAEVTVEVDVLRTAAARVRAVAEGLGGSVSSEATGYRQYADLTGEDGAVGRTAAPGESVLVLRVPEPDLDTALEQVAATGTELARTTSSQDVTGELADLGSRVETATQSVSRVRALLGDATKLSEIVLLESELTTRQSDLEALQARQAALADRADLATVTVVLRTPEAVEGEAGTGFVAGLRSGWDALVTSTVVLLQLLGALLPWAVVVLVLGWPLVLLARRRRARLSEAS